MLTKRWLTRAGRRIALTAVWLPPWALIIALQAVTAGASIGRLTTSYYIVSRAYNALALGAVAADFAIKYFVTGRGDDLTSGIVFTHREPTI